jgi:hypothetical protein
LGVLGVNWVGEGKAISQLTLEIMRQLLGFAKKLSIIA